MQTCFHVTPAANLEAIFKEGLLPKRGRRSKALGEAEISIFAFPDVASLTDGLANWLGEQFAENAALAVLAFEVSPEEMAPSSVAWEVRLVQPVHPSRLLLVTADAHYWNAQWPGAETQPRRKRKKAAPR